MSALVIGEDLAILCVNGGAGAAQTCDIDMAAGGDRLWLLTDERGSVIAAVNEDGKTRQINAYDAFGHQKPWNEGVFRYTGQSFVHELDLYNYKARFYHPDFGRFMQTDPIGYEDQMNLYAYVGNDPMNLVDPSGEFGFGAFAKFFGVGEAYNSKRSTD